MSGDHTTYFPPHITVLGGGSWGTTIASLCAHQAPTVQWVRSPQVAEEINTDHTNSRYLGAQIHLAESLRATTDFPQALAHADIVVVAIPSQAFRSVLHRAQPHLPSPIPVISATKGFEQHTILRMSQLIEHLLPMHSAGVLSGPNLAHEVAQGLPAGAVLACHDLSLCSWIAPWFSGPTFRIYPSDDVIGVEIAGALKNIYAIAAGIGHALQIGENAHAFLLTCALREMTHLGQAMGAKMETFYGLAGMGDLTLTCGSARSRNHYVGQQLGQGKTVHEVLASMDQAAEGLSTLDTVLDLAHTYQVHMPVAHMVHHVITHTYDPRSAYQLLFSQPPHQEIQQGVGVS